EARLDEHAASIDQPGAGDLQAVDRIEQRSRARSKMARDEQDEKSQRDDRRGEVRSSTPSQKCFHAQAEREENRERQPVHVLRSWTFGQRGEKRRDGRSGEYDD